MQGNISRILLCIFFCHFMAETPYAALIIRPQSNNKDSTNITTKDSLSLQEKANSQNSSDFFKLKPRIGFGLGTLTFMGDVANNYKEQHLTISRIAYDFSISNRINNYLDLSFYILRGKVAANEQNLNRNLNFESTISTGGFLLTYNFDHFLNKERWIEPYVQIGIESLEFLSKADLYDRNGNKYFYWSTGAIMSKPEDDPEAKSAVVLNRDYHYETDLRKLNLDGFGNYDERSLAIPIGVGFKMKLTDEMTFQFGTNLHYTFTDFIDNVSANGKNERKGDKSMDKLLFTSFSLSYLLPFNKKDPSLEDFPNGKEDPYYVLQYGDEDNDGVLDLDDDCPGTSPFATVDEKGCALDGDNDGVADFMDEELESAPNAVVDEKGITLSPEKLAEIYKTSQQGKFKIMRSSFKGLQGGTSEEPEENEKEKYFLTVPEKETEGNNSLLLNQPDLITKSSNGKISYQLGPYPNTDETLKRQSEIKAQGITTKVELKDGTPVDIPENNTNEQIEPTVNANQTIFRIQIGAFSKSIPLERFAGLPNVTGIRGNDGLVRYMSGAFNNLSDAANHKVQLTLKGYNETFIVAYRNGKKISLKEAGAKFTEESGTEGSYQEPAPIVISQENIKFRIKLGAFDLGVPKNVMDALFNLKNVKIMREDGASHYYHGLFNSFEEAEDALEKVFDYGIKAAFVVGDFDGKIIEATEAQRLLDN